MVYSDLHGETVQAFHEVTHKQGVKLIAVSNKALDSTAINGLILQQVSLNKTKVIKTNVTKVDNI